MALVGHVDPNLMGATRLEPARNQRKSGEGVQYRIMGDSMATVRDDRHFLTVFGMPTNGGVNLSLNGLRRPFDNGPIQAGCGVCFELLGQMLVGVVIFCDNQQAAGLFVQTMHNARPDDTPNA